MDTRLIITVTVLLWQQHDVMVAGDTLYDTDSSVIQLNVRNFEQTLARKSHGWVVEFYATWCGHCQHFAPVYNDFANDISDWSSVMRVAAIACSAPENMPVCRSQNVGGFPTVKFYPPDMQIVTRGFKLAPLHFRVTDVRSKALDFIENYVTRSHGILPRLQRYGNIERLLEDARTKGTSHAFIIVEEDQTVNTELAKAVILDMSPDYPRVLIGRLRKSAILDQESLWQPLPSVLSVGIRDGRVRFVTQLNTRDDVTRVIQTLSSGSWRPDHNIPVTPIGSLPVQTSTQPSYREPVVSMRPTGQEIPLMIPLQTTLTPGSADHQTPGPDYTYSPAVKLEPVDMDSNIYYMLWNEVASRERIRGSALSAFKHYLEILAKYHPSDERLHSFLETVYGWMKLMRGSVDSTLYLNTVDSLQTNDSHVIKQLTWSACAGSEARFRGYPCSVWMTFHALTVAAYEHHLQHPQEPFDPMEVLGAIRGYVRHFLGCRGCAGHFHKMARRMESEVSRPEDVILWLWWGHNRANNRLHGDTTEDPYHPKIQFPGPTACPSCRHGNGPFDRYNNESDWNIPEVLDYLRHFYSVENIMGYVPSTPLTITILPTLAGPLNNNATRSGAVPSLSPPGINPHGPYTQTNTGIQATEVQLPRDPRQPPSPWEHKQQPPRAIRPHRTVPPSRPTAAPSLPAANTSCVVMTTAWSACTMSCNAGVSTRLSNANVRCEMELEMRVCQIRPCSYSIGNPRSGMEHCTANMRSETRMALTFNGCTTKKAYRWRFCNRCHGYCCKPVNDGTFWADVTCRHGDDEVGGAMQINWIVSCSCTRGNCDET